MTDTQTFVSRRERRRQQEKSQLARAVAHNAGIMGRGAAATVAAAGLVAASGVAANAATDGQAREVTTLQVAPSSLSVERASNNASVNVAASRDVQLSFDRPEVSSAPAPTPEPAPEPEPTPEPAQETAPQQNQGGQQSQGNGGQQAQQSQGNGGGQSTTSQNDGGQQTQASAPSSTGGGNGAIVAAAQRGLGTPYVFGGKGPGGWDCSGFVAWAYAQAGYSIPSSTAAIRGSGQFARTSNPQPGDLVVQNGGGHVAIYLGNGQMIGAQNPSTGTIQYGPERVGNVTNYYLTLR